MSIPALTGVAFVLIFLTATQDIAVDGACLTRRRAPSVSRPLMSRTGRPQA